jgi:dTDP-4-dehydrorhamnose reductase
MFGIIKLCFVGSCFCLAGANFAPALHYHGLAQTVLVFGGSTGWFGRLAVNILKEHGHNVVTAKSRLENRADIIHELELVKPDCVINAAGITGRPNIDWCEDHRIETIRANLIGALTLADVTHERGIHLTNFGTGCFYTYDLAHPMGSGKGFTESDEPNCLTSFYYQSKVYLEKMLQQYPNVLNLRFGMPASSDTNPRNFIIKITKYKKVINVLNSLSVLDDLLPVAVDMSLRKLTGIYNFVNPGTISHNEVLELYKQYIDPAFTYQNFSLEEQSQLLKGGRSNCELNVSKLLYEYPDIPMIKQSIVKILQKMSDRVIWNTFDTTGN